MRRQETIVGENPARFPPTFPRRHRGVRSHGLHRHQSEPRSLKQFCFPTVFAIFFNRPRTYRHNFLLNRFYSYASLVLYRILPTVPEHSRQSFLPTSEHAPRILSTYPGTGVRLNVTDKTLVSIIIVISVQPSFTFHSDSPSLNEFSRESKPDPSSFSLDYKQSIRIYT